MDTPVLVAKEIDKVKPEIESILIQVQAFEVKTEDEYAFAIALTRKIKERHNMLDELRKNITKPLDQAKRSVMDMFRVPSGTLTNSEVMLKSKMLKYQREQDTLRRQQEEKLRIETEKKKAKMFKKADKINEDMPETADELRQDADTLVAPSVAAPPAPAGVSTRKLWKADVFDVNILPRMYMVPNQKMLDELARASKGVLKIPGVRFHSEEVMAVR